MDVAADLKKKKLTDFANTLDGQLQTARSSLDSAGLELQTLRVRTITLPSEGGPISAGVQKRATRSIKEYFDQVDRVRRHPSRRATAAELIANVRRDSVPSDALLEIRSVASGAPVAQALRNAVTDYHTTRAKLAEQRVNLTDENPVVKSLIAQLNSLKNGKDSATGHGPR